MDSNQFEEDFAVWRDGAVTRRLFEALDSYAHRAKASWMDASWQRGEVSSELLADLRARYEAAMSIRNITAQQIEDELSNDK